MSTNLIKQAAREARRSLSAYDAIDAALGAEWRLVRDPKHFEGQARIGVFACMREFNIGSVPPALRGDDFRNLTREVYSHAADASLRSVVVRDITTAHLSLAVSRWIDYGRPPATINWRLAAMSVIGVETRGCYQKPSRRLKWWLKPDEEARLVQHLRDMGDDTMADYVMWAASTGLRVEETLRLRRSDFSMSRTEAGNLEVTVTVPGLKTHAAQATLPVSAAAAAVFLNRFPPGSDPNAKLFEVRYEHLRDKWAACRAWLGHSNNRLCTLKALRRSFARKAHVKGMPLDVLRQYLRHERIATTMEYLKLTGGYSGQEFARWL